MYDITQKNEILTWERAMVTASLVYIARMLLLQVRDGEPEIIVRQWVD